MFAKIIPARRMPLSLSFLDYQIPEKLLKDTRIGQLVTVPFRNQQIFGVIHTIARDTEADLKKIKPISSMVAIPPLFSSAQLEFIKEIAEFYHTSAGFVLKSNLPPLQKRKLSKLAIAEMPQQENSKFTKPDLFIYKNFSEKERILKEKIQEDGQTLILAPEVADIEAIQELIPKKLANETVAITSDLSDKQEFEKWFEVRSGEKRVVIGTRRALFLPWFNLRRIIMDDEANPNYKSWDMAPRIHTRDAATFLAKHHGAELFFLSHSPSVETFYFGKEKVYNSKSELSAFNAKTEIIDMREERRGGNYGFLSERMTQAIENSKGDCFLFLNRRGSASFVGCRDCGNVIKCPKCHLALNFHQDSGQLICHYCGYKEPMVTKCKVCQGVNVAMFGVGTQQAEKEARKILGAGSSRKVIRIDSDVNGIEETKSSSLKIIIGTQLAWPYINWQKTDVVAFLDADASLFIPEYKVTETLWQLIRQAQFNMQGPAEGKILIQTGHPDHLIYQSLSKPAEFYERQLTERRALGYPPFKYLVKFFAGHPNLQSIKKEASELSFRLSNLTKANSDITILGPLEASPQFLDGLYWEIILAKINYQTYKKSVKLLMSNIPENWKADPNPNTILQFS